ncbi:hypothetical protein EVAR_74337_1 [Eumeta japonica]|uniref:Uncharacterized protein n=1 Tax=Eumeta variegata TaxID=151549 RepID=A0A4C1SD81_EUMVA|nr:hypothetical protein EVAR_74337_1 [Eumeta japonica]
MDAVGNIALADSVSKVEKSTLRLFWIGKSYADQIGGILKKGQILITGNRRVCMKRLMDVHEAKEKPCATYFIPHPESASGKCIVSRFFRPINNMSRASHKRRRRYCRPLNRFKTRGPCCFPPFSSRFNRELRLQVSGRAARVGGPGAGGRRGV